MAAFSLLIELFIAIIGISVFLFLVKFLKAKIYKYTLFILVSTISIYYSLSVFPCSEFCPKDFITHSRTIISNYDEIAINDYKNSYHTEDVLINNAILYKFRLPERFYYIEYLQIIDSNSIPDKFKSFPIWIMNDSVLYDNKTMRYTKKDNIFSFKDSIENFSVEFKIGKDGLNDVSDFYSGGESHIGEVDGKAYRESGVVDQHNVRIIVDKSDPDLEIESNYGKLMRYYLQWKNKATIQPHLF